MPFFMLLCPKFKPFVNFLAVLLLLLSSPTSGTNHGKGQNHWCGFGFLQEQQECSQMGT